MLVPATILTASFSQKAMQHLEIMVCLCAGMLSRSLNPSKVSRQPTWQEFLGMPLISHAKLGMSQSDEASMLCKVCTHLDGLQRMLIETWRLHFRPVSIVLLRRDIKGSTQEPAAPRGAGAVCECSGSGSSAVWDRRRRQQQRNADAEGARTQSGRGPQYRDNHSTAKATWHA